MIYISNTRVLTYRSQRPAIGSFLEPRTVMNNMTMAANFVESPVESQAGGRKELFKKQLQKLSRKMQVRIDKISDSLHTGPQWVGITLLCIFLLGC